MQNRFFVVVNGNAAPDSWSAWVWSDIRNLAEIYLDNNTLSTDLLKRLKKFHFGNKTNRMMWLPFKRIWDKSSSIKINSLNEKDRNYIIFQSGVKFSPGYIEKLKKKKNSCIVLYLPDTINNLGLASNREEFIRYCDYYKIDVVFSFDEKDCKEYGLKFFDIYSSLMANETNSAVHQGVFYMGSCRNPERLGLLIEVYDKLHEAIQCDFNIVGVDGNEQRHTDEITYNKPMKYQDVVRNVKGSDCILELVNTGQSGNTLRFKEAICYNRRLLTNNQSVKNSKYYNPEWIQVFDDVRQIDTDWLKRSVDVDFGYAGEFSPVELIKEIVEADRRI